METKDTGQFQTTRPKIVQRSFFTKKLERKFDEKGLDIPQKILNLMDVPFNQFSEDEKELYENQIKPLAFVLAENLIEVYEVMGQPRRGWEEMMERLEDSPMKVVAMLVIHEQEKVESMPPDPETIEQEVPSLSSGREKFSVRLYPEKDARKERWWDRKIF